MWVRNLEGPSPKKFGGPKTSKFRILRFDREYLRMETRYRRSENGVEKCNHSPTCTPNLVNFGPQTAKNRICISTHWIDFFGRSYLSSRNVWDCRRPIVSYSHLTACVNLSYCMGRFTKAQTAINDRPWKHKCKLGPTGKRSNGNAKFTV